MRYLFLLLFLLTNISCTTIAEREGDKLILRGWGSKSAKWEDGAEITKEEPIRVPNILPIGR